MLAGVKLLWKERELSPDFRVFPFSSLLRVPSFEGGVPTPDLLGDDFAAEFVEVDAIRGVCGRLEGLALCGRPSTSSKEPSPCWVSPLGLSDGIRAPS